MTTRQTDKQVLHKVLLFILTGVSTILGYISTLQREQVKSLEKSKESDRQYYRTLVDNSNKQILKITREKDSLQGVILTRTDESFKELKNIMEIKSKSSTITIKPKRNR